MGVHTNPKREFEDARIEYYLVIAARRERAVDLVISRRAMALSQPEALVLKLRYFRASKKIGLALKCGSNP